MKKRIPTFAAGMVTMALFGSIGVTALAASGAMTITVDPVNIQVNGATFQPKDATGKDVPVFALNGTTYAPLRALAEAYGLEVGYDADKNMATVEAVVPATTPTPDTVLSDDYSTWTAEEEAAYQEFKGMWSIAKGSSIYNDLVIWRGDYVGELNYNVYGSVGLHAELKKIGEKTIAQYVLRIAKEIQEQYPDEKLFFELYGRDVIEGKVYPAPISISSFLIDGDTYIGLGFGGL